MASRSDLSRRVDAVLNRKSAINRGRLFGLGLVALAIAIPILAGSIRVTHVEAVEPADQSETAIDKDSVAERVEELQRREAETLSATAELREVIVEELATALKSGAGKDHTMTVLFLTTSLAELGQFDTIKKLRDDVRATGEEALARVVNNYSDGLFTAHMRRRDYAAADKAKSRSNSDTTQYGMISWAIRNRDLDVAEKMMADLEKVKLKNGIPRYSGPLMLGHAQLAAAAHWLGEDERIIPALRRYRALAEQKDVSDRPFDEDADWVKADGMFGPHFVLILASCGQADLAESLAKTLNVSNPSRSHGYFPYSTLNLCGRLAVAGETERSLRIAREKWNGVVPAELLRVLCRAAIRDGKLDAARQFAEEFHTAVSEFSFTYWPPHQRVRDSITEQSKLLDQLNSAAKLTALFVGDMKAEQKPELARAAAAIYVKLTDRFVDEFENKSTEKDWQGWRRHDRPIFKSDLDLIVEFLSADERLSYAKRHRAFVEKHAKYLESARSRKQARLKLDMVLASLGFVPDDLSRFPMRERMLLMERLLAAGNQAGAKAVFEPTRKHVTRVEYVGAVSGSAGGRVVNVATQSRYVAAQMAVKFGEVTAGVAIIDLLKHRGERVDGYRVIAKTYAEATDLATAFEWAKSLDDSDLRLAACVGVLQTESAIMEVTETDELGKFIDEVRSFGEPFIFWGC